MALITLNFAFLDVVLFIVYVVVMSILGGRILGLRVPRWRAIVTAVLGQVAGIVGTEAIARRSNTGLQYLLVLLFSLLANMILLIVPEAIGRARRVGARGPSVRRLLRPIRWIREELAPLSRSWEVLGYARQRRLTRPQFLSAEALTTPEFAHRLRLAIEDSGGMFIKFGQIASTRSDLLSPAVITELSLLRASVRPIPAEELRPLLEAELNRPVEEAFASFDFEPMAAASIGQTHRAVLTSGERVVVKIQRPGLNELLRRDATVLRLVAGFAERRSPNASLLGVRDLAEELIIGMERELDYLREGGMADRLRSVIDPLGGDEQIIHVPHVHHTLSTDRLLVMEEAQGRRIDQPGAIAASGVSPNELAAALLGSYFTQILQGGVFHADPHPGNMMVDESGRLWMLDFGSVGLIDPASRRALQDIALGASLQEPLLIARAIRNLAGSDSAASLQSLETDIGLLLIESGAGGFSPGMIQDVLLIMARQGLRVPPSMSLLGRALLTLDGTLRTIDPTFDLKVEAERAISGLSPGETDVREQLLKQEIERALPVLRSVPDHIDELATQLRAGRLGIRVERFAGQDNRVVSHWIDRVLTGLIGAFGLIASALLLLAAELSKSHDAQLALRAIGFTGLVVAAILVMRAVAHILRRDRMAPGSSDRSDARRAIELDL